MKNIFTMLSLSKMKDQIKCVFSRFPFSLLFIVIFTGLLLSILHGDFSQITENNILRGIFSSVIGFFFSLGFYIYSESKDQSKFSKHLTQLIPVGYTVLFYIFFQNTLESIDEVIFFTLSIAGIIGFLFFAPYLKNILSGNGKQSVYYTYFYNISVIILTSFILGGVLFSLGAVGITAVHQLFDLSGYFTNEIYGDWAIISLGLLTPLFALTKIPKKREFTNNYFNENVFFSFLIKYIAIPFIYLYFIILYVYSAKVLMNFSEWPKGEVSWMVIGFSIFGYLIYVFSYIFEEKNNFIKTFRKYFPFAVIPQIFMLFYAIYLRIAQYDITINRYFVVIFGIWLLCISLYYALSKKKYLGNITVLLTLFTVIISVGPWSVYQLPESRQLERLKNNLIQANILQENIIIPLDNYSDIDKELSKEIYGGIDYLCDFNNCEEIKKLFPEIYLELEKKDKEQWEKNREENINEYEEKIGTYSENFNNHQDVIYNKERLQELKNSKYNGPSRWNIRNHITDTIKVKEYYDKYQQSSIYIQGDNRNIFPLDIRGYSQIIEIRQNSGKETFAKLYIAQKKIDIFEGEKLINSINIEKILNDITKKYSSEENSKFTNEDLIFDVNSNGNTYKIIFNYLEIQNPESKILYDWDWDLNGSGYLLIK